MSLAPNGNWIDGRTAALARLLRSGDVDDMYDALVDARKQGLRALAPDIGPLLSHSEPDVRRAAVHALAADWRLPEYRQAAERLWREDPDPLVRATALMGWARYYDASRDAAVLGALERLLRDADEDPGVRERAYLELFTVSGRLRAMSAREVAALVDADVAEDVDGRVDWSQVAEMVRPSAASG
jgi:HEAT repeat protein